MATAIRVVMLDTRIPDVKICFVKDRVASRFHKHPPARVLFPALKRTAARAFTTRNFKHAIVLLLAHK
ncbi:hypothetical protein DBV15_03224 [Temnothorax longispinosus]|uniref:Uncharacterized protein n=1 Tax=Temnothorax longispinosus TaxID=300112 RepID=A0A4V3SCN1_9HYME|nr:hypothetical protein DBV15_03224 [Temnothorax longispinosus]